MTFKYEVLKRRVRNINIKKMRSDMSTEELLENRRRQYAKNRIPVWIPGLCLRRRHAHCRNAWEEMRMLDEAFDAVIAQAPGAPMAHWKALRAQMPGWDEVRRRYGQ